MAKKSNPMRVVLETGPKGKRVVALAPDWPGLERGAKTAETAIEKMQSYFPRYAKIAKLAGMEEEFGDITNVKVVERYAGTGSTDFWGISFAFSSIDKQIMSIEELERELALMQACWKYFDKVRARVSAELQKGPRGGGRDRDRIVLHVSAVEQDWAGGLGIKIKEGEWFTDLERLKVFRRDYCKAIRAFHADGKMSGKWPLRYLIRHTAFHTLDHAWEMEDRDMSVRQTKTKSKVL
jgi:hypothetical protein